MMVCFITEEYRDPNRINALLKKNIKHTHTKTHSNIHFRIYICVLGIILFIASTSTLNPFS